MEISLHFTLKDQELTVIQDTLNNEPAFNTIKAKSNLNHCFLSLQEVITRELPIDVIEYLNSVADTTTEWFVDMDSLPEQREAMLNHIKDSNGIAIFVGDVVDGVLEEWNICMEKNISVLHIPKKQDE